MRFCGARAKLMAKLYGSVDRRKLMMNEIQTEVSYYIQPYQAVRLYTADY